MYPKIRMVQESDVEDVLEISRHVWEGHDYLPYVIRVWLNDPNSHIYGIEVDSHIVGLGNLRLVEKGQTGWMEGLRIHPDYRGKGLANKLTKHIISEARHLKVQRLRYTTAVDNLASLQLAEKTGFMRLLMMGVVWHSNPILIPEKRSFPAIRESSPEEAYELVKGNSEINPRLLVYNWKALDSTLEGFKTVGESNEFHVALRKSKLDSFSFGHLWHEPTGSERSFTIYAATADSFLSHFSYHVSLALELEHPAIACTYETKFEKTLYSVDWVSKENRGIHLILLEKSMS
ncbi:MAG: GNAT family N-acetyltransferase [Candidatus Bathyarchaeota archaeon]|nr:GNAT family N-acetyltransferase [Candidatus Bathyarchaeota archaeon]